MFLVNGQVYQGIARLLRFLWREPFEILTSLLSFRIGFQIQ